ncbi:crotonase/enoyl-CoA hydratase family protein [Aliiroseovarius sp. YM-037]|uniref:crotonase/enoyl-CoA hydratase family protein n=1 Tax=Aliiroseovarius sp. YM-037 TaxID=3341728 RepID=UPI003A80B6CE
MSERVDISRSGPVATVTLTRPDKRNALDLSMIKGIVAAGEGLQEDKTLRAVILQGDGPAFSAGLDTGAFQTIIAEAAKSGGVTARTHGTANIFQQAAMVWSDLPVPVIAAVHGFAFGGAFQIMLGADIRIATPDCRFAIMEGKWGLIPDMGGMVLMPRLARSDVIRRLTYTAEEFGAHQALEWGFVTELDDDPQARAAKLAEQIAARSPETVRAAKALISETERMPDPAEILMRESVVQETLIGSPNQIEAVIAGLEKRQPTFKDPK